MIGLVFGYLPELLALISFLVALFLMGPAPRGGAWWTMLAGIALALGSLVLYIFYMDFGLMGPPPNDFFVRSVIRLANKFGYLVFGFGFVMHALVRKRERERVTELEMIIAAQNEQLARQQG